MSAPVFVIDREVASTARPGDVVTLDGPEGRHAATVMRLSVGEAVELVDGRGTRLTGQVRATAAQSLALDVSRVEREPARDIEFALVQALAKGDRDDLAIQTATELGAGHIVPWQARNSVVKWRADRVAKASTKWRDALLSAAKQSRRSWHPTLGDLVDSRTLTALIASSIDRGDTVIVLHESAREQLSDVPRPKANPAAGEPARVWFVVGPEGGISADEMAAFADAGATAVRLGPHVLRTSTAGPAAIAAFSALWGVWECRDRLVP